MSGTAGGEIPIGAAKQRPLLALLLLRRGELVPTSVLVERLWGAGTRDRDEGGAGVRVAELRKLLWKELIETRPGGYLVQIDPDAVDAVGFETLIASGRDLIATGKTGAARERLG